MVVIETSSAHIHWNLVEPLKHFHTIINERNELRIGLGGKGGGGGRGGGGDRAMSMPMWT